MELTNTNSIASICDELCEESVLGTLLSYPTRINDSRDILTDECFFNNKTAGFSIIDQILKTL